MSGGSVYETSTAFAGSYVCKLFVTSSSNHYDNSFSFSLIMALPTTPDPATDLTEITTSTTSTSLEFKWIAPVNDGGSAVTGYVINGEDAPYSWTYSNPNYTGGTSIAVSGLTPSNTYTFFINAINSVGIGA